MRSKAWLLMVVLLTSMGVGCSTPRMGLTKSEPPQPTTEERVQYGMPWKKPNPDKSLASADSKKLPDELVSKMTEARSETLNSRKPKVDESLQRAASAEASGDLDSARAAYLDVVSMEPTNAEAHHRLGVIADMNQDPVTADEHYSKAYAANPRDADLLSDMGYSLYLRGRFEAAEARLKEALEYNQYHRAAQTNLGLVYGKQGKYDQALAMFRQSGTESEAQRHMAALFPGGNPSSLAGNAAAPPAMANSLPVTANNQGPMAPPFPPELDRNAAGPSFDQIRQQMDQQRQMAEQSRQNVSNPSPWGTTPQTPVNQNPFAATGTSPWGTPAASGQTTAKATDQADTWPGNFPGNPGPNAPPAGNAAAPWGQMNPAAPQGMAAAPPANNAFPHPNSGFPMAAPGTVTPSTFEDKPAWGTGAAVVPAVATTPGNPRTDAQWAAQLALATGPGGMFPYSNPNAAPAMNSGFPAAPGTAPAATAPPANAGYWPSTGASSSNWQQPAPATPQPAPVTFAERPSNSVTPGTNAWGSDWPATPSPRWQMPAAPSAPAAPAAPPAQPGNAGAGNWQQLAPPSPWNDVPMTSAWEQPGAATGATASATTFSGVQTWPSNEGQSPASNNSELPVVVPAGGTAAPPLTRSSNSGFAPAPSGNFAPSTTGSSTVPNWPYSASRP